MPPAVHGVAAYFEREEKRMNYQEQLIQELKQAELQLQEMEALERKKNETAEVAEQPIIKNSTEEAGSKSDNSDKQGNVTQR